MKRLASRKPLRHRLFSVLPRVLPRVPNSVVEFKATFFVDAASVNYLFVSGTPPDFCPFPFAHSQESFHLTSFSPCFATPRQWHILSPRGHHHKTLRRFRLRCRPPLVDTRVDAEYGGNVNHSHLVDLMTSLEAYDSEVDLEQRVGTLLTND